MHLQPPIRAIVPNVLSRELLSVPKRGDNIPGLIVSADDLSKQNATFSSAIKSLVPENGHPRTPAFMIPPQETFNLFEHSAELDLLKSVAGLIAQQVHPHLKTGIDVLWLVYKAAQLKDEWDKPGRDSVACCFKMAGLALDAAKLPGTVYPELKLSDSWSNGFNFLVKSGDSLWQGKTVPVTELVFSTEKRLEIPLKVLKVAGLSLDPQPLSQQPIVGHFARPTIIPLFTKGLLGEK